MASTNMLNKIFAHQLSLTETIRKELEAHLTEELHAAFADHEAFLKQLQGQKEIPQSDLEHLQKMWEDLMQSLERSGFIPLSSDASPANNTSKRTPVPAT